MRLIPISVKIREYTTYNSFLDIIILKSKERLSCSHIYGIYRSCENIKGEFRACRLGIKAFNGTDDVINITSHLKMLIYCHRFIKFKRMIFKILRKKKLRKKYIDKIIYYIKK